MSAFKVAICDLEAWSAFCLRRTGSVFCGLLSISAFCIPLRNMLGNCWYLGNYESALASFQVLWEPQ